MSGPGCTVCAHPEVQAINEALKAQHDAVARGVSMTAMSPSAIAKQYGIPKTTLLRHKANCLGLSRLDVLRETRTPLERVEAMVAQLGPQPGPNSDRGVDRVDGTRTDADESVCFAENLSDSAGGPELGPVRVGVDESARAVRVEARSASEDASRGVVDREVGDVVGAGLGVASSDVPSSPTALSGNARARVVAISRTSGSIGSNAHAMHDLASQPATDHASQIQDLASATFSNHTHEIAMMILEARWRDYASIVELSRRWCVKRSTVMNYYRQACALVALTHGTPAQQRVNSMARWRELYDLALKSDAKDALRVAAEALKGFDHVAQLVERGTKVQVNVAQSDEAQQFLRLVFDALRPYPDALAAVRQRLREARAGGESDVEIVSINE